MLSYTPINASTHILFLIDVALYHLQAQHHHNR
jgi:hypothetical protein